MNQELIAHITSVISKDPSQSTAKKSELFCQMVEEYYRGQVYVIPIPLTDKELDEINDHNALRFHWLELKPNEQIDIPGFNKARREEGGKDA
jgi:hypothetical protein